MRIAESELIINADGSAFHIHLRPEELADIVVLVGDQSRIDFFKDYFTDIECEHSSREFHSLTGSYHGKRVTALSTGIGTDNIDIVMTELDALANVDFATREVRPELRKLKILRIGTSGAIHPDIPIGASVFSHYSIGCDGLLNWYADRDSISNLAMEEAFKKHVKWNKHLPDPYFAKAGEDMIRRFEDCTVKGMTISASGFYGPQGRVVRLPLAMPDMIRDFETFSFDGYRIANFEMEGSAIAGLARHMGHEAGTVCCIIANRYLKSSNTDYKPMVHSLVGLALDRLTM